MGIEASPGVKFAIIRETVNESGGGMNISELCALAGVSRSGYYNWLRGEEQRESREAADRADFARILKAYQYRGYDKGGRGIYMRLLHETPPIRMNLKKIRRLMNKFGLKCPIRKANPYRRMAKALATNQVADNALNREFESHGPRSVLLTDITYLPYEGGWCYLSVIIDAYTKQVLSYQLSDNLAVDFVLETVREMLKKHGGELHTDVLLHSDQGCHYTSYAFVDLLKDAELRQSMSRKGNCWDNAPQESFFGHMKDEVAIDPNCTLDDVRARVDDWIDYYNNERYQWDLMKLSPNEYWDYLCTDNYPLPN